MKITSGILDNEMESKNKMEKIIYFENDSQRTDRCVGQVYAEFLEYAFTETDYFMLVYANYYGKGYTKIMKSFLKELRPFQVKRRTNPSWPGTLGTICPNTTYKVVFYRTAPEAKETLKKVNQLSQWSSPSYPQDLAFFKGNQCWLYSVGHEKIAALLHASEKDIDFVAKTGLARREDAYALDVEYFRAYDEELE